MSRGTQVCTWLERVRHALHDPCHEGQPNSTEQSMTCDPYWQSGGRLGVAARHCV